MYIYIWHTICTYSIQTLIRHSMTTRFLTTCVSSQLFAGQNTLHDIHTALAEDCRRAFYDGIEVVLSLYCKVNFAIELRFYHDAGFWYLLLACKVRDGLRLHLACIAGKGDWKYLREAGGCKKHVTLKHRRTL